jgi:hypothetical protein
MATKKTTGKKLADMMYGDPERAAFGITPMIGKRREDRQDREAAKSFPVDLARGAVAGFVGMPADILNIPGAVYSAVTDKDLYKIPYGSEDILKSLPFGTETPAGQFASGLGILGGGSANIGPAIRGVKAGARGALAAGRAGARMAERVVPQIMERGGAGADVLSGLAQGSRSNVIKPKGGNWLGGSVERALEKLKRDTAAGNDPAEMLSRMRERYTPEEIAKLPEGVMKQHVLNSFAELERDVALNNWVDRNLTNYVKKEMATPEDPVRRLAEEGITHLPANEIDFHTQWVPEDLALSRMRAGFPTEGLGQSNTAKGWEAITDSYINSAPASEYTKPLTESEVRRGFGSVVGDNPWLTKLDPETPVQYIKSADSIAQDLRLDHIMDVLREDVNSGRIRPEQLNKVSMEQAVRRTYEYDQEMAKRMRETALKQQEGFPLYKEYPEGYRWIELTTPEPKIPEGSVFEEYNGMQRLFGPDGESLSVGATKEEATKLYKRQEREKQLEEALQYEGDTMGHCVGGYCPDVLEGRSRIFSLRDAKGEPHVTIEVEPNQNPYPVSGEAFAMLPQATKAQYGQYVREWRQRNPNVTELTDEHTAQALREAGVQPQPDRVIQIKGKQNAAPKDTYLPYVQDFVRSGQWSDVGDLRNTGLIRKSDLIDKFSPDELDAVGVGEYLTKAEQDDLLLKALNARQPGLTDELGLTPPEEGMARGGRVHFSDNPDVMQLELAGGGAVRMQAGGLAKAAKALKAAKEAAVPLTLPRVRPTTQDIMEAAERVGKQQAGEFVRSPLLKDTTNLAGRSKKEVERLKELQYKLTPIKNLPEVKPYEAQVGEVNIVLPGDQTISDMLLESVDDVPIGTTSEGGALFGRGRLADPEDKRAFWSSNIGPAEQFQKKVTELAELYNTDMVTAYHLAMGQMSNNFAQHMADASMRAIDYSKLNKNKMNAFDRVVSMGYVDPKTKERVTFENWPGIADPEASLQAMKEDPKLRKWFVNRMKTEKVTKPLDLPYGKSIEWAMTEPELRNMEINLTGLSAGRMKPGAELIPDSAHQTYSHDIPGTALGRAPELSPFSISFPDATAFVREKYRPQDFTGTIQKVFPHQVVDEAYLEDMYKYYTQLRKVRGFNEGGAVRKAAGGEITADDLILEERKL